MKYLKGYTKNRLKGISFSAYITYTEALGGDFVDSNTTKYLYPMIEHPVSGAFALSVSEENEQYLDEGYEEELVTEATMTIDGWFPVEE